MLLKPGKMFLKLLWRSSFGWLLVRLMEPFSLRLRKPWTGSQRKGLDYTQRFINHWSRRMWKPALGFFPSICSFLSSVAFGCAVHSCAIGAAHTSARSAGLRSFTDVILPSKPLLPWKLSAGMEKGGKILVHCKFTGGELSWCFSDALQIRTRLKGLELFLKIQSLSECDAWKKHAFHRHVDAINGWEMWIEASCMKWMNGWLILISHLVPVFAQQPIKGLTGTNKVTKKFCWKD